MLKVTFGMKTGRHLVRLRPSSPKRSKRLAFIAYLRTPLRSVCYLLAEGRKAGSESGPTSFISTRAGLHGAFADPCRERHAVELEMRSLAGRQGFESRNAGLETKEVVWAVTGPIGLAGLFADHPPAVSAVGG